MLSPAEALHWYAAAAGPPHVLSCSPHRLELAAHECGQTVSVDLEQIIQACESCQSVLEPAMNNESSPIRLVRAIPYSSSFSSILLQAALHQVLLALAHHKTVLSAKQQQLQMSSSTALHQQSTRATQRGPTSPHDMTVAMSDQPSSPAPAHGHTDEMSDRCAGRLVSLCIAPLVNPIGDTKPSWTL